MKIKIGLVASIKNNLSWTQECIRTLEQSTQKTNHETWVVDSNSSDGTPGFLQKQNINLILLEQDISIVKGFNLGIKSIIEKYDPEYIGLFHNDVLFVNGWVEDMLKIMGEFPKCGLLGAATIMGDDILSLSDEERKTISYGGREKRTVPANIFPWIIKTEVFKKIGYFDEKEFVEECNDCEFQKRMAEAGYETLGTNGVVLFHRWVLSRFNRPEAREEAARARELWKKKYPDIPLERYNYSVKKPIYVDGVPWIRYGV